METDKVLRENIDNSKLLVKLSIIGGIGSAVMAILVLILSGISSWAGSDVFALSILPLALTAVFSLGSMIYGILAASAAQEDEDKRLLEKRKENIAVINVNEDVRFTAGRSFENYKKYTPYFLAAFAAAITFALLGLFWYYHSARTVIPVPENALKSAFVAVMLMCICIFSGAFFVGQSREKDFRWLRPLGAWLILAFVVSLFATFSALMFRFGYPQVDKYLSRVAFVLYALLGVEFVINFITEFYRPRTIEEPRPVFESRLLALFTEPGGVARNVADTLDYQFGFKVSKTWISEFTEKYLFRLVIAWLICLWMFTCIFEVGPSQVGVRERFGRIVSEELLSPGIYFALPYPFGKVARYSCTEIHDVLVGPGMIDANGKKLRPEVVTWTEKHYATESEFLVASEKIDNALKPATSVSFLGISLPIQYRIRKSGLINFAYKHKDAPNILQNIGEMAATKYFASVSIMEIMSSGRQKAAEDLKMQIQQAADSQNLGVDIVYVNLHDVHPPTEKVAPAFEAVIGSIEEKETEILKAKSYRERVIPQAQADKMQIDAQAKSYRYQITTVAQAEGERFNKQLQAYDAMPEIFKLRTYLDMLEKDCADTRKYIMSSSIPNEIYELNFEQKARFDLIDADVNSLSDQPIK
jgi:regulator of protease activity HflC (stomatin/prohibitin superfamily)